MSRNNLLQINLQYQKDLPALNAEGGKLGKYLGSGDGTVIGDNLRGSVRWDLFENQGNQVCDANINGVIKTDDLVEIHFSVLGLFRKLDSGNKWKLAAGVQFESNSPKYQWLNAAPGSWVGIFDMENYSHQYTISLS